MTLAVGCTGGKHRSVAMAEEIAAPARATRRRRRRRPPRPGAGVTAGRRRRPRVVGARRRARLRASLPALRRVTDDAHRGRRRSPTTAARRGRLRGELGVLPPGDLRMALAALCGDDELGPAPGRDVLQHRFAGDGDARTATRSATC